MAYQYAIIGANNMVIGSVRQEHPADSPSYVLLDPDETMEYCVGKRYNSARTGVNRWDDVSHQNPQVKGNPMVEEFENQRIDTMKIKDRVQSIGEQLSNIERQLDFIIDKIRNSTSIDPNKGNRISK